MYVQKGFFMTRINNEHIEITRAHPGYTTKIVATDCDVIDTYAPLKPDQEDTDSATFLVQTRKDAYKAAGSVLYALQVHKSGSLIDHGYINKEEYASVNYPYQPMCFQTGIIGELTNMVQEQSEFNLRLCGTASIETAPFLTTDSLLMKYQIRRKLEVIGALSPHTVNASFALLSVVLSDNSLTILDNDNDEIGRVALESSSYDTEQKLVEALGRCAGIHDTQAILFYGWHPSDLLTTNLELLMGRPRSVIYAGDAQEVPWGRLIAKLKPHHDQEFLS